MIKMGTWYVCVCFILLNDLLSLSVFSLSLSLFIKLTVGGENQLYLPFIDFPCVFGNQTFLNLPNDTTAVSSNTYQNLYKSVTIFIYLFILFYYFHRNEGFRNLTLMTVDGDPETSNIKSDTGPCFNDTATCRYVNNYY